MKSMCQRITRMYRGGATRQGDASSSRRNTGREPSSSSHARCTHQGFCYMPQAPQGNIVSYTALYTLGWLCMWSARV